MPRPHYLILNAGGLRSLVATALLLQQSEPPRLTVLYIGDGRDNTATRRSFASRQCEHFGLGKLHEFALPQLYGMGLGRGRGGEPIGTLAAPQLLLAALAYTRASQAEQLIWPAAFNADHHAMAQATEQTTLCQHLAETESLPVPTLEAPLLELTDQQVLELGSQLQVPWHLAWSCLTATDQPCGSCAGCRRRHAAFEKAGLIDQPTTRAHLMAHSTSHH